MPEAEGSFEPVANVGDGSGMNRRECPHCGLSYRLDEGKPAGENAVRCPYCDWKVENA